jgi:hypothetical protein
MIKSVGAILVGQRVTLPVVSLLALFIECQFRPQGKSKIPPTNNFPVVPGTKSVRRKSCTKPSNRLRMYFILPQTVLQQTPMDVQQGPDCRATGQIKVVERIGRLPFAGHASKYFLLLPQTAPNSVANPCRVLRRTKGVDTWV